MKYGLSEEEINQLENLFSGFDKIEQVILYGSRAKGTHKPFSDIDITLKGESLNNEYLNSIIIAIDDLLLPYQFDISIYSKLKHPELLDHINRKGVVLYSK